MRTLPETGSANAQRRSRPNIEERPALFRTGSLFARRGCAGPALARCCRQPTTVPPDPAIRLGGWLRGCDAGRRHCTGDLPGRGSLATAAKLIRQVEWLVDNQVFSRPRRDARLMGGNRYAIGLCHLVSMPTEAAPRRRFGRELAHKASEAAQRGSYAERGYPPPRPHLTAQPICPLKGAGAHSLGVLLALFGKKLKTMCWKSLQRTESGAAQIISLTGPDGYWSSTGVKCSRLAGYPSIAGSILCALASHHRALPRPYCDAIGGSKLTHKSPDMTIERLHLSRRRGPAGQHRYYGHDDARCCRFDSRTSRRRDTPRFGPECQVRFVEKYAITFR